MHFHARKREELAVAVEQELRWKDQSGCRHQEEPRQPAPVSLLVLPDVPRLPQATLAAIEIARIETEAFHRLLEQMGAELGFAVLGLGLVPIEGETSGLPYSSTEIRRLLSEGRVREAARLYARPPRPHEVRGVVVMGDQRGRELGFPTANVAVPSRMCLPADGIYAASDRF